MYDVVENLLENLSFGTVSMDKSFLGMLLHQNINHFRIKCVPHSCQELIF
jgi:hypothetical protein